MGCACGKRLRGFTPGTVTGYTISADENAGCLSFEDRCVVFPTPEAAEAAAIEQGFVEWRLTPVTV